MPSNLHFDERIEVTVIVPCFNTAQYLDQCLTSIEADDFASLEVIVLNDGSTDNSLEIMRRHEKMIPEFALLISRTRGMALRSIGVLRSLEVHTLPLSSPMITLSLVCIQD